MPEADINRLYDYSPDYLAEILRSVKTIAMVGASGDKTKFSYGVLRVLHETGYLSCRHALLHGQLLLLLPAPLFHQRKIRHAQMHPQIHLWPQRQVVLIDLPIDPRPPATVAVFAPLESVAGLD